MTLSESTLTALKELAKTNPQVKELLDFYEFVTGQSAYEGYVARRVTLDKWDSDLIANKVSLFSKDDNDEEKAKARDKEVDRVLKYLEKQTLLHEQTEQMFEKMSGEEQETVNRDKRIQKGEDRAFRPKPKAD